MEYIDRAELKRLRHESLRPTFRRRIIEHCGDRCSNCGSETGIEYHHIVPLAVGGTNNLSNFVALCYKCHKVAHGYDMAKESAKNGKHGGRPQRTLPENATEIFDDYVWGRIDKDEAENLLGVTKGGKLNDVKQFKAYLKDKGIEKHQNLIKSKASKNPKLEDGMVLARIRFTDGTVTEIYKFGDGTKIKELGFKFI